MRHPLYINVDFLKLWAAKTISTFGSIITRDALPLAAILTLDASASQLGVLGALGRLPALLVGLPAGVWVDRLRRKPIMIAADLARAGLLFTIPLAAALGVLSLAQLGVVAFLAGALTVFFQVADNAFLPAIVSREQLLEGNSKLGVSDSLAEIAGPALAGGLVQLVTAPFAILIDALSFLVSALTLALIRTHERPPERPVRRPSMRHEIVEGLRSVLQNRILLALAVASASFSFLGGFIGATYYLYAISELQLAPTLLGITISGGGIGALLGAALAGRITRRAGLGPALIGGLFVHGLMALVIPLARGPAVLATGILFTGQLIGDAALMLYFVNDISLRQSVTPDRLLGRVNASMQFVMAAVGPLGLLLGGFLGQAIGLRPTLLLGALGSLLGSAWLLLSPVRGLRVFPTTDEHSSTPILDDSSHFEDNP